MKKDNKIWFHFLALMTVCIWGCTLVSTKTLIQSGLSPIAIFLYRSLIAWIGMAFIAPKKLFANNWQDEFWMLLAGLFGGTLYFVSENYALTWTYVANISLIVCIAPLITAALTAFFWPQEKLSKKLLIGSFIALCGVALVVFNGRFIFKLSPIGDLLTLVAATSWAFFYCLILKHIEKRYTTAFITRKVFFYGCITLIPFIYVWPWSFDPHVFTSVSVWGNLLFLALIASMLCFFMWTKAIKGIGPVTSTNYIYIVPLVGMLTSSVVLNEPINFVMICGAAMIILGVFFGQR